LAAAGAAAAAVSVLAAALGALGTQFYNRRRDSREKRVIKREQQAADDVASERLIKLIEREADKRVAIVRAEFELIIAKLKLEQLQKDVAKAAELTAIRADFERQIAEIKQAGETYRCDVAPDCDLRHKGEIKAGGTD